MDVDSDSVGVADSAGLLGTWRLEAEGEPAGTALDLRGGELALLRSCASVWGTWAARGGIFLGDMSDDANRLSVNAGCPTDPEVTLPLWLTKVSRYVKSDDGWRLLDAGGATVATLLAGGEYPAGALKGRSWWERGSGRDENRPGAEERAALNATPTAALPAAVRPATAAELVGRWETGAATRDGCDRPYLDLRAGGGWVGHDDADDHHGRWAAGADGVVLGTAESREGGGCGDEDEVAGPDISPTAVDVWLTRVARAGLRGERLVLFDPAGAELVDLTRRQPPPPSDDVDHDGLSDSTGDGNVERPQEPPPPPDPRREGVPVAGGTKYLVSIDSHQFDLWSGGRRPEYEDDWDESQVLGVDHTGGAAKILTGCESGDTWLTVRVRTSAPATPLAKAMKGWEVGEEDTMTLGSALSVGDAYGWYEAQQVFKPAKPGLHCVRLLAKGRNLQWDDVCESPVEHYELTIWPVGEKDPRVRLGDDGV